MFQKQLKIFWNNQMKIKNTMLFWLKWLATDMTLFLMLQHHNNFYTLYIIVIERCHFLNEEESSCYVLLSYQLVKHLMNKWTPGAHYPFLLTNDNPFLAVNYSFHLKLFRHFCFRASRLLLIVLNFLFGPCN